MEPFLSELIDSYRAYFDIEMVDDGSLRCIASYHSRTEGYVLTKKVGLWSVKDDEYVMFHVSEDVSEESLNGMISKSLTHSKDLIVPDKDHRSSMLTSIIVCKRLEPKCVKTIKSYKYHRNFRFMLNGWMDHRLVLLSLNDGVSISDRLGKGPLENALRVLEKVKG